VKHQIVTAKFPTAECRDPPFRRPVLEALGIAVLVAVANLIAKAKTPSNSKSMYWTLVQQSPRVRAPP
jgi:hypothetical protein